MRNLNLEPPANFSRSVTPGDTTEIRPLKILPVLLLFFGFLGHWIPGSLWAGEAPTTLVIPFKVSPAAEKAHQWLGRAVSFYLISGLQANNLPVVPDHQGAAILEANHIMFPYHITKATVMEIAQQYRLDRLVWGEILLENHETEPGGKSLIQVRAFVIDLNESSQKYLPLIEGNINDLYKIEAELLTAVAKTLTPPEPAGSAGPPGQTGQVEVKLHYPQFHLDHRNYEIFIKSLLLEENKKKILLLEKAQKALAGESSDFLNIELAKLYVDSGKWEEAEALLEKIPADNQNVSPLVNREKLFLKGLAAVAKKNSADAINAFTTLQQDRQFAFAAHHNLGVIYFKRSDYRRAESHFRQALTQRSDPGTQWSLVHLLLARGDTRQAALQLKQALRLFPEDEKLVELFAYFLAQAENRELLFSLFQNYIPGLFLPEGENQDQEPALPAVSLRLKNPFKLQLQKPYPDNPEANDTLKDPEEGGEGVDNSIERLQGLLEVNPFEPGYYRSLSLLYLKKKEYRQAELHGLALIFLEETKENYLLMAKIYKAMKNKKKAKEMQTKSAVLFRPGKQEPFNDE
jgi:uncharacterized protein HemY